MSSIKIEIIDGVPEGASELLSKTVYGVPGGLQYQHLNSLERIEAIVNPKFLCLTRGDRLMGMVGFSGREARIGDHATMAWYVRYLTMPSVGRMKDERNGRVKADEKKKSIGIKSYFSDLLSQGFSKLGQGGFSYALLEKGNDYSRHICDTYGYQTVRQMGTYAFSRIRPKGNVGVRELRDDEKPMVLETVDRFYRGYNLFFKDHVFLQGTYYVFERDGQVVAGAKAMKVRWRMDNIPGFWGRFLVKNGGRIPIIHKIFNPQDFRFLAFEALWCLPGSESMLISLLEGVCERLGYNMGMIWADTDSPLSELIGKHLRSGLIGMFRSDEPTEIIMNYDATDEELSRELHSKPIYISAFDLV